MVLCYYGAAVLYYCDGIVFDTMVLPLYIYLIQMLLTQCCIVKSHVSNNVFAYMAKFNQLHVKKCTCLNMTSTWKYSKYLLILTCAMR